MKNWLLWFLIGVVSILGGLMALANPLAATLAAEKVAGWVFLLVGLLQIVSAFREQALGATLWAGLIGVLGLFVGISLLANPLAGAVSLTALIAILFAVVGVAKLVMAFQIRSTRFFWLVLVSGGVSLLLALLIVSFPQSAARILGLFLAIELLSNGASLIALSLTRRPTA
ncbi:HdeD family acid-resistance protein [Mesorhizobium xinjiangense]|uniref:HdeD family acid-resistance protein n=1 Tax=Mesorhizobium xinjiangense TaxID=2678685 RepID=UPI0012EDB6F6|nr:DUF308 domain-containing protein [Mesorhizobium xinjiangense]